EVLQLRQVWSLSCDAPTAPTVAFLPGSKSGPASSPVSVDATALAALLKTSPACRPELRHPTACSKTALHFQVAPHLPFPLSLVLPVPPSKQSLEPFS
ncbi:hypothetical protein T484DRAFT_1774794, partial [Baffinella frigidus]